MEYYVYSLLALIVGVLSFGTTRFVLWVDIRDIPNARSSHVMPTPKAGGFAIFLPFCCCLVWNLLTYGGGAAFWAILGASTGMAFMGLWDDVKGLSWKTRLLVQLLMAAFVVFFGIYVQGIELPYFGYVSFGSAAPLLSMVGIVVFTNLYNFMDGLNGLSIGCTLIGLGFLGIILVFHPSGVRHMEPLLVMLISLWVSLGVLFFFNFPRARIFLGDTGSQFLGFTIIVVGIMLSTLEPGTSLPILNGNQLPSFSFSPLLVPFLFFPFSFDGCVTILRRLFLWVPIWEADRGHVFHRLLDKSSAVHVVVAHFGLFICSGFIVWIFLDFPPRFFILGGVPLLVLHGFYLMFVLVKRKEIPHA